MRTKVRIFVPCLSAFAGAAAIYLILQPAAGSGQKSWLLLAVAALLLTSLFSALPGAMGAPGGKATLDAESSVDREIHDEAAKIIAALRDHAEASGSFQAVLTKANSQLPDLLNASQVRLVISYLMIENENMRVRGTTLQASLERSQLQIEGLKSSLAIAEHQGLSDGLTGLRNRRGFDIMLANEVAAAKSTRKPLSLVIADIDHFKAVNDRHGHQTGDEVLKWFARILSSHIKGRDTVARYGGEEFAIILPQTNLEIATMLASQIRQQLQTRHWTNPDNPAASLQVTASFGVAQLAQDEGTSRLVQRADAKLYELKSAGRNRVAA